MDSHIQKRVRVGKAATHGNEHTRKTVDTLDRPARETADPSWALQRIVIGARAGIRPSEILALHKKVGNKALQAVLAKTERQQSLASNPAISLNQTTDAVGDSDERYVQEANPVAYQVAHQAHYNSDQGIVLQRVTDIAGRNGEEGPWYAETTKGSRVYVDPNGKGAARKNCHGHTYGTSVRWGYSPAQSAAGVGKIIEDEAGLKLFKAPVLWIRENVKKGVPSKGQLIVFWMGATPAHSAKTVNTAKRWDEVKIDSVQGYGGARDANKNITEEMQWADGNTIWVYGAVPQPTGDQTPEGQAYRA